jgi:hypothetical protein
MGKIIFILSNILLFLLFISVSYYDLNNVPMPVKKPLEEAIFISFILLLLGYHRKPRKYSVHRNFVKEPVLERV